MHAVYGRDGGIEGDFATYRASFPEPPSPAPRPDPTPLAPRSAGFAGAARPNWIAIAIILGAHVLLLAALVKFDMIAVSKPKRAPLIVDLLALPPTPPPVAPQPPEAKPSPEKPVEQQIFAPDPVVAAPTPPPPVAIVSEPPPQRAAIVAPPSPAPVVAVPISAPDLSSTVLSDPNPRIGVESRRKRERGTVYVLVLVGLDGKVDEIALSRSSGFPRLDQAVLEAVRRWRWVPAVRNGHPVMVRGVVDVTINPPSA